MTALLGSALRTFRDISPTGTVYKRPTLLYLPQSASRCQLARRHLPRPLNASTSLDLNPHTSSARMYVLYLSLQPSQWLTTPRFGQPSSLLASFRKCLVHEQEIRHLP